MVILERHIQCVKKEKEYWEGEKKWEAIEQRLGGFPAKKHYHLLSGRDDTDTIVWEREWDSFTAMETAYSKMFTDSETHNISTPEGTVTSERIEYYYPAG